MHALLDQTDAPFVASEAEADIAKEAAKGLQQFASGDHDVVLHVREAAEIAVPIPARAMKLLVSVLVAMAERKPFSLIPSDAEFTTQQVADYLNVSRPYVTGLIDKGDLPARMVGRHRRVRFADLTDYEKKSMDLRRKAIADMARETKNLGLD